MMKFQAGLSAVLVGVTITIVQPQIAQALSSTEVAKVAKSITVLIKASDSNGSGVIIKRVGNTYTVLTAGHVVARQDTYKIIPSDGKEYALNYSTVKKLPGVDLALVQFTSDQSYGVAVIGNSKQSPEGSAAYVAGFPATKTITESIYNFTEGKITANANRPLADGYALVYTNPTLPGMSGGSVLNDKGELIGIHGRADTTDQPQNAAINPNIYVKTGFNLGIPINTFSMLTPDTSLVTQTAPISIASIQPKADDFYLKGVEKQDKQDYKGAIAEYDKAIALNPEYVQAYDKRALSRSILGDNQGAVSDYTQVIELNPKDYGSYFNRGSIRDKLGDKKGALNDFKTIVDFSDDSSLVGFSKPLVHRLQKPPPLLTQPLSNIFVSLGMVLEGDAKYKNGNYQGAIDDYDKAISLDPKYSYAYIGRGQARNRLLDEQGASEDFDRAIALDQKNVSFYIIRGNARFYWHNQQGAINDFNKALEIDPKNAEAYYSRGYAYTLQFKRQAAINDYNKAIAINPKYAVAYFYRGNAYFNLSKYREANNDYTQVISLLPNWPEAFKQRGEARSGLGDKKGQLADFQRAADLWKQQGDKFSYELILGDIHNLQKCGDTICGKINLKFDFLPSQPSIN
jgi:tetratricopeptide (TPR) repeat protein